jgi:hypothetical protein
MISRNSFVTFRPKVVRRKAQIFSSSVAAVSYLFSAKRRALIPAWGIAPGNLADRKQALKARFNGAPPK